MTPHTSTSHASPGPISFDVILVVTDREVTPEAITSARGLVPPDAAWTILVPIPLHPRYTSGATGFAGPVLTMQEMDSIARADQMEGDAIAASWAHLWGPTPVHHAIERGGAVDAVRAHLGAHDVDLVVVCDPDLAEELTRHDIVPVLAVTNSDRSTRRNDIGGPVLVAVDDTPLDDGVISTATRLFDPTTNAYLAVHVDASRSIAQAMPIAALTPGATGADMVSFLTDDLRVAADSAKRVADHAIIGSDISNAQTAGEAGDAASGILALAEEHRASVIVVGTHHRGWLSRLLRPSVADAVLHAAACPVLIASTPGDEHRDQHDRSGS